MMHFLRSVFGWLWPVTHSAELSKMDYSDITKLLAKANTALENLIALTRIQTAALSESDELIKAQDSYIKTLEFALDVANKTLEGVANLDVLPPPTQKAIEIYLLSRAMHKSEQDRPNSPDIEGAA